MSVKRLLLPAAATTVGMTTGVMYSSATKAKG